MEKCVSARLSCVRVCTNRHLTIHVKKRGSEKNAQTRCTFVKARSHRLSDLHDGGDDPHGLLGPQQDLRVDAVRDGVDDPPPHEHHGGHDHVAEADGSEVREPQGVLLLLRGRRQAVPPLRRVIVGRAKGIACSISLNVA